MHGWAFFGGFGFLSGEEGGGGMKERDAMRSREREGGVMDVVVSPDSGLMNVGWYDYAMGLI